MTNENAAIETELEKIKNAFPQDLEVIGDVSDVLKDRVLPLIVEQASKKQHIKIENFGLDLETVMPWINHKIISSKKFGVVRFEMKSLIINPKSAYLKDLINGSSNISSTTINASIEAAKNLINHDAYRFSFELRQYDLPPIFHGFLVNEEHLFLGFTEIVNGKLIGGTKPYLHLCKQPDDTSEITAHYFNIFKDWFEYYWTRSKEVAHVKKERI